MNPSLLMFQTLECLGKDTSEALRLPALKRVPRKPELSVAFISSAQNFSQRRLPPISNPLSQHSALPCGVCQRHNRLPRATQGKLYGVLSPRNRSAWRVGAHRITSNDCVLSPTDIPLASSIIHVRNTSQVARNFVQDKTERWFQLCQQAAVEQDPDKLLTLIKEINNLLEDKERRLQRKRDDEETTLRS